MKNKRSINKAFSAVLFAAIAMLLLSSGVSYDNFTKLLQLRGTWAMQTKKGVLYEEWKKTGEAEMSGTSYRLNQKDTLLLERVKLRREGDDILYIPSAQNQNNGQPVVFKLVRAEANKFTFENKLHDFPQRIIYNLITNDSIVARIEGSKNGVTDGSDFYFKRLN